MVMAEIELKHSLWLRVLVIAMVLLAAVSIVSAHLAVSIQTLLATGLLGGIGWGFWQGRKPLPGVRIQPNGQIQVSVAGGDWARAEVLSGFITPGLTVVRLRTADDAVYRLTLLPDSASPEALRQLRVSLRWAPRTRSDTRFPGAG